MALKIILRKKLDDGKVLALFPEIPGKNIDECLICDEDGHKYSAPVKGIIKQSQKIEKDTVTWLIEKLEQEFGRLKLVNKEHVGDYNKRFQKLSFYR